MFPGTRLPVHISMNRLRFTVMRSLRLTMSAVTVSAVNRTIRLRQMKSIRILNPLENIPSVRCASYLLSQSLARRSLLLKRPWTVLSDLRCCRLLPFRAVSRFLPDLEVPRSADSVRQISWLM